MDVILASGRNASRSAAALQEVPSPLRGASHSLALHEVTLANGEFISLSADGGPFDPYTFSCVKYGGNAQALYAFAGHLVNDRLLPYLNATLSPAEPIVVTGTPLRRVANTAKHLAVVVEHMLRTAGFDSRYSIIGQERLAGGDYGHLSAAERAARNSAKRRFFDPSDFEGRHVVIVDDVHVTGSIVRSTVGLFNDVPILGTTVATLVRLDPFLVSTTPQLEYALNHVAISDINALYRLMHEDPSFSLNTRAIKFILECPPTAVEDFARTCDVGILRLLYTGAIDDGYDLMERYTDTFGVLSKALVERMYL